MDTSEKDFETTVVERLCKTGKLTKCSQDTAHRDIQALVERGVLVQNPEGGRS